MATTSNIDLTPFGFTPTESLAYASLLELGPTSAYALAKKLSLARANAYQAVNGLRTKGAASLIDSDPQVFRATHPDALLVMITDRDMAKLDRLEQQLRTPQVPDSPETEPFTNERAFREIALRTTVRAGVVTCAAPGKILRALNPIWRKRAADDAASVLWVLGQEEGDLAIAVAGSAEVPAGLASLLGQSPVIVLADWAAIIGRHTEEGLSGYWTSDPLFRGLTEGALAHIIGQ